MYIVPRDGFLLRDPDRHDRIPPEGREVPDSAYWHRRLADGDVTLGEALPEHDVDAPPEDQAEPTPMITSAVEDPAAPIALHEEVAG